MVSVWSGEPCGSIRSSRSPVWPMSGPGLREGEGRPRLPTGHEPHAARDQQEQDEDRQDLAHLIDSTGVSRSCGGHASMRWRSWSRRSSNSGASLSSRSGASSVRTLAQSREPACRIEDALDIRPVPRPVGERLEDDRILGRTGAQVNVGRIPEGRRPLNRAGLEREAAESDIQPHAGLRPQQQHAVCECERVRIGYTSGEDGRQAVDEARLIPKPVSSVRSTSTVSRASPQRWRATPPMRQCRQPSASQTACSSAAAAMTAFTRGVRAKTGAAARSAQRSGEARAARRGGRPVRRAARWHRRRRPLAARADGWPRGAARRPSRSAPSAGRARAPQASTSRGRKAVAYGQLYLRC